MLRTLREVNLVSYPTVTVEVPRGLYRGFYFLITGTEKAYSNGSAGFVNANCDLGNIMVTVDGKPTVNASVTMLMLLNQRIFKAPLNIGVSGTAAFQFGIYVPATVDERTLPNCWYGASDGRIQLQFTSGGAFAESTVNAAAINLGIYADTGYDPAAFVPWYLEMTDTIASGAGNVLNNVSIPNLTDAIIYPYSAYNATTGANGATPGWAFSTMLTAAGGRVLFQRGDDIPMECTGLAAVAVQELWDELELGQTLLSDTLANVPYYLHIVPGGRRTIESILADDFRIQLNAASGGYTKTLYCGAQLLGANAIASREYARAKVANAASKKSKAEIVKVVTSAGIIKGVTSAKISQNVKDAVK
jgi:hypothetical protein